MHHRATLIQDIKEFMGFIRPHVSDLYSLHAKGQWHSEEDIIKWIIAEEIEMIFGLFDVAHVHNGMNETIIHSLLNQKLKGKLSSIICFYFRVPRIYSDENQIEIKIKGSDLYIKYYTDRQTYNYSL